MEELSGGGSRRPSRGADEREKKVGCRRSVAEGWLAEEDTEKERDEKKEGIG